MPGDDSYEYNEFVKIARHCDFVLDFARDTVDGIPARREEVLKKLDKAKARHRRVSEELARIRSNSPGTWNEDVAKESASDASIEIRRINAYLMGPDFDVEYEKAFARQISVLLREEYTPRLDELAARSDPELQQTIAEFKDELSSSVHRILKRYKEAGPLELSEVRKVRAEAQRVLDEEFPPPT